jgi:hypothetical protein
MLELAASLLSINMQVATPTGLTAFVDSDCSDYECCRDR